ncbi:MAG: GxxExxY protein [Verrucomicrobiota bacterium]
MKNRIFAMQELEDPLARQIIGLAMKVHRILGCGFSESVYRNALTIELRRADIAFVVHPTLSVTYEGIEVGAFQADLIIDGRLIVELKAVEGLNTAHSAQLVHYLRATNIDYGLLLNFGTQSLEFKTKSRHYPPPDLHS